MLRKRAFFLLWMLLSASVWSQTSVNSAADSSLRLGGITMGDSQGAVANYWYYFPENRFVDSLRVDSLAQRFAVGLQLQFPTDKAYRLRDKYDPFLH